VKGLFGIAVRNLFRARRRNLLSGGTMVLGSGALVLGSGLTDGIERQLTSNLVSVQTGHVQVVVRAADFQPQNSPFDAYGAERVPDAVALAHRLETEGRAAGVVKAVPYLYGRGTAIAGNRSSIAAIVGVLPAREPELAAAFPPVTGTFLPEGDELAVAVTAPVARKLRLQVGDTVSLVLQTPEGAVNSLDLVVCGVLRKNAPWYDNAFFLSLPAAQRLFDWPGGATNVKITLADGTPRGARKARDAVAAIVGPPPALPRDGRLKIETYDEAGRFSFAIVQANRTALTILSSFLFAAAAVGIVNSMLMSVHERTREIGTIRALGMRRRLVVRLFVLEGLALGLASAVAGVVLGGALVLHWGARGIPMNTMTLAWMAGGEALFPVLTVASVARAVVSIALLSTLAAVYPALTASRLEPREALQHA
jgi:putative ABC transport system permease protein